MVPYSHIKVFKADCPMIISTDYGRPMKLFFIEITNFLGLARQFGQINFGAFGVSPLSMFSINQPLFLQKVSLYIQIPNIYLGLGFEFGLQRIRDLAIVCNVSSP